MSVKERVLVDGGRGVVVLDAVMDGMGAYATLTAGGEGTPPWTDGQAISMLAAQELNRDIFWFVGYEDGEWTALVRLAGPYRRGISHGVGKYHRIARVLKVYKGAEVSVTEELTRDQALDKMAGAGWDRNQADLALGALDEHAACDGDECKYVNNFVGVGTYHAITRTEDGMYAYGGFRRRREV